MHEWLLTVDTLVFTINKLETNHQCREGFDEGTKPTKIVNVVCVFLKLLYCPIGINITLVAYSILLYEYELNILTLYN